MTTVVVVRKGRDIAIAADTMTKWGSGKETADYVVNHGKLLQVGDTWLGLTGNATFKTILRDYFSRPKVRARFDTPLAIFRTWQTLHVALKADYNLIATGHDDEPLESTRFDALVPPRHLRRGRAPYRAGVLALLRFRQRQQLCDGRTACAAR